MKKLFTDGWKFLETHYGSSYEEVMGRIAEFNAVTIPHDYMICNPKDLYRDSTGWYIKDFEVSADDLCGEMALVFDGIYMDSIVYVNGKAAGEWKYGYSQFILNITEYVVQGTNHLAVAARCKFPNTRWYSGAGIYRNVYLCKYEKTYIPENGIYVHSEKVANCAFTKSEAGIVHRSEIESETGSYVEVENGAKASDEVGKNNQGLCTYRMTVSTEVCGDTDGVTVRYELLEQKSNMRGVNSRGEMPSDARMLERICADGSSEINCHEVVLDEQKTRSLILDEAGLNDNFGLENAPVTVSEWSVEAPNLYTLRVTLSRNGEVLQTEDVTVGFRQTRFNPEKGFFLNGKNMKLNGVCLHHDLGALGSAYNNTAMRRRLVQLREMGVNALRLTHNMYAPEVVRLADEMGFLLISEAFDMWEGPKTEFDYARFFPKWHERDVASWVRRDRNHPSVILWSIGNEIYDTHSSERGQEVTRDLKSLVEKNDPLFNARATIGSNYMPWEMAQKCADILKIAGYNYAENYYEEHHKAHPDWVIYGSETYSIVQSRGIYHFPLSVPCLSDTDEQCSSLGNSTTSWGADSIEACICKDRDMEFSMGQFIWTGYDYIGEPTPYHTKNSYFGLIDTAGFYKDAFYAWKSAWVSMEQDPFVHLFPFWDFNEGQLIDLRICSNAPQVELFVNGKSMGRQTLTHAPHSGNKIFADYQVVYEKGEITAVAYDAAGNEIARETRKSFGDTASFKVDIDHRLDKYEDTDLVFAEISALDEAGNSVENASDYVKVSVSGGTLIGLDNGDSTDYDSYQASTRKLFAGKLLAIVKPTGAIGDVKVNVERAEFVPVRKVELKVVGDAGGDVGIVGNIDNAAEDVEIFHGVAGDMETLHGKDVTSDITGITMTAKRRSVIVKAHVLPADATNKEIVFRALNKNGTETNIAKVHVIKNPETLEEKTAMRKICDSGDLSDVLCKVEAIGDGSFTLRCEAKSGRDVVGVMSTLDFEVTGLGTAFLDPYGFIPGSLYTSYVGQIGNGNDHGVASAKGEETLISYSGIDFGKDGSDTITVPIFTLNDDAYDIEIWKGIPGEEGAALLKKAVYQKKTIWNVYQEDTWKLSEKLTGVQTISFKVFNKFHIKGFSFEKKLRAFEGIRALDADSIYGDSFEKTEDNVERIGNNVTLGFDEVDFGYVKGSDSKNLDAKSIDAEKSSAVEEMTSACELGGVRTITICGRTRNTANTIHLRFKKCADDIEYVNSVTEAQEIFEFPQSSDYTEVTFPIAPRQGKWDLSFVFLPGSDFDFKSFRFGRG